MSERLLKTADAMKKRFHLFQLRSMQKEVASTEETMLLKLFVDDLKQSIEHEKRTLKDEQECLTKQEKHSKNLLQHHQLQQQQQLLQQQQQANKESPSTIRRILGASLTNKQHQPNLNNINNDFDLLSGVNPLKRQLKHEETNSELDDEREETANKLFKNSTHLNLSKVHILASSSAAASSSSPQSTGSIKLEATNVNNVSMKPENEFKMSSFVNNFSSSDSAGNQNQTKPECDEYVEDYEEDEEDEEEDDDEDEEDDEDEDERTGAGEGKTHKNSAAVNMSGLNDLLLNEDELAVQGILDY